MIALAVTSAIAVGLFAAPQAGFAAPTPPPNPSDGQISAAAAQKNALANQVGQLSGELADKQNQLQQSRNASALAEQRVARDVSRYRDSVDARDRAIAKAAASKKKFAEANEAVEKERTQFARYMQAIYMDGAPSGLTGTMLTADDPNALLQQSSYQSYEVQNNVGVIGTMQVATVTRSNAAAAARNDAAKARDAAKVAEKRKNQSIQTQQDAAETVRTQEQDERDLTASMAVTQTSLDSAQTALATLNGQRATFLAFKEQQRLAAIAKAKRIAAIKRAQAIQRAQAIERQKQQEAAEKARNKKSKKKKSGGSSSSGGGSSFNPPVYAPPAPTGKGWTQAKAAKALARAKSTLGMPYAWAGGGPSGPSYGVCDASNGAGGDCNVFGYDCSGLVMFAWKKNWDHYADTQYTQAGSYHPKKSKLKIGDLVFFGSRGGGNDLHHVAMYAGHGQIIEAPYSGGVVQYNSLNAYSDYYGATRPLT